MSMSKQHPLGAPVSRNEILRRLNEHPRTRRQFESLSERLQMEFLDYCAGASGLKVCYDPIFKFILDPEHHPERISELLSVLLKQEIKVKRVLSREGERLLAKGSLVIMDLVVELEDGSLATVEIQKISHAFPGSRGACYSSDLVMRQYSKVKDRRKSKFSYQDLKTVYTIVILENSPAEFHEFPGTYIHHARQHFDTGLSMNLLQEYVFVALDVYKEFMHNRTIETTLEAWLGFLSFEDPERIWEIETGFPQMKPMYQDMADFRRNVEEVLMIFSKELAVMDQNNVQYMIDEGKAEVKRLNRLLKAEQKESKALQRESKIQQKEMSAQQITIKEQEKTIEKLRKMLEEQQKTLEDIQNKLDAQEE